jgi:hypothetical protein
MKRITNHQTDVILRRYRAQGVALKIIRDDDLRDDVNLAIRLGVDKDTYVLVAHIPASGYTLDAIASQLYQLLGTYLDITTTSNAVYVVIRRIPV